MTSASKTNNLSMLERLEKEHPKLHRLVVDFEGSIPGPALHQFSVAEDMTTGVYKITFRVDPKKLT